MMATLVIEANRLIHHHELTIASNKNITPAQKLYRLAELASALFVAFLTIHPYADGNGHMSRMLIHLCFAQYGHKIRMPLHPRPQPPFASLPDLIDLFRQGHTSPLVTYLLSTL